MFISIYSNCFIYTQSFCFRGDETDDDDNAIYVQRKDRTNSYIIRTSTLAGSVERNLLSNVVDFEVRHEYILATVNTVRLIIEFSE